MKIRDVVVVGGGPVGLFMGICLLHRGIPCTVVEKRTELAPGSRSLGIHPVSLELFEQTGLIDAFLESGIKVRKGYAHTGRKELGVIDFKDCPEPYNYILINPQEKTEQILRQRLLEMDPEALINGVEVIGVNQQQDEVLVTLLKDEVHQTINVGYVIGCDGKKSFVRQQAGIRFTGERYPDTYIMGDLPDNTEFGTDACVYLHEDGLVECFPLPDGKRRWVAKTSDYVAEPDLRMLAEMVEDRTGTELGDHPDANVSSFGVQHMLADHFVKDRIILAGDAAHVVSPIGGQGMNLGWLDAWELAKVMSFCRALSKEAPISDLFIYEMNMRPIAKKVARRAEINMRLGRTSGLPVIRNGVLKMVLHSPARNLLAKLFTMRGLDSWWI